MIKISDAIKDICSQQSLLAFGLKNKLFNLTALAKFLKPLVEARTKKDIKLTAILMSLSRLQNKITTKSTQLSSVPIINTTVHFGLCSISFYNSKNLFNQLNKLDKEIREKHGYISIIQGIQEISIIIEQIYFPLVQKYIKEKPKNLREHITSLNIQVADDVYETPGQFYPIVQAITLQGINIYEITSAFSEIIFYLDEKDIKLTFDTIYSSLQKK